MRRKSRFKKKVVGKRVDKGKMSVRETAELGGGKNKFVEEESVCLFDFLHRNKAECEHKLRE